MRKKIDLKAVIATATKPEVDAQLTFNELAHAWLASTNNGDDLYRLRKWQDVFGPRVAWTINTDEIATAAEGMLAHGYAPGSVNRDVGAIGSMFKWIIQKRRAPAGFTSPTLNVRRFPEDARVVEVADETIQRLKTIALTYRNKGLALFVALLADSGARKGELYPRKWKDIDLEQRRIVLSSADTKTGKARVLFFKPETADLIKRLFPKRNPDALVFPGRDATTPINYRTSWTTLCKEAGCPDLHMHDIRHHRARELVLVEGVSYAAAAKVLGHSVAVLEKRYAHLTVDDVQSAIDAAWSKAA